MIVEVRVNIATSVFYKLWEKSSREQRYMDCGPEPDILHKATQAMEIMNKTNYESTMS